MSAWRWSAFLIVPLFVVPAKAQSDAPIVYCARYYSLTATTHFHLYRINPNGSGKRQITFGNVDDYMPTWSPDGTRIVFLRGDALWLVNADGKNARLFYKIHPTDFFTRRWTPDGKSVLVIGGDGKAVRVALSTGKASPYLPPIPPKEIEVKAVPNGVQFTKPLPDGTQKEFSLTFSPALKKRIDAGDLEADCWRAGSNLPQNGAMLLCQTAGDSTSGHWYYYYRVDEATQTLSFLTQGGTLSWSPSATQFVTTLGRDLTSLSKKDKRQVWTSELLVGTMTKDGNVTMRPIVSGLVHAGNSDWRGGERTIVP